MHGPELCQIVENNQWISDAIVLDSGCKEESQRLQVSISPKGHQAISEFGFPVFTKTLLAELSSLQRLQIDLEFRHCHHWVLERYQYDRENRQPGILSWVSELSQHRLLIDVSGESVFFKGHFPGNPVLPGITQLHWAVGVTMSLFDSNEVPEEIKRLKFKKIVQPSSVLELCLKQCNEHEVQFQFVSSGQVHSMGNLRFKDTLSC